MVLAVASKPKGPTPRDPVERFWELVDRRGPDECWMWRGERKGGSWDYGVLYLISRTDGSHREVRAHRFAWELEHGEIPEGMCVLHHCDNPPCVNEEHLFLGTNADNTQDCLLKGRHHNSTRTHCPQGHLYDEENTYIHPVTGYRQCRACQVQRRERRRQ